MATLLDQGSVYGRRSVPFIMSPEESVNIDDEMDLVTAEALWQSLHSTPVSREPVGSPQEGDL